MAAAVAGALLGHLGGVVTPGSRAGLATSLSLAGVAIGAAELLGRRFRPLQCDRETPRRWVDAGAYMWAVKNGGALGTGLVSRIGFPLWYAVPAGALLSGTTGIGALVYGSYGLARGLGALGIMLAARKMRFDHIADELIAARPLARVVTSGFLLCASVSVLVAVGS